MIGLIDFIENSINRVNIAYFGLVERMNMWEVSSLMRHYLSPMDFVELDTPNLLKDNKDGMKK